MRESLDKKAGNGVVLDLNAFYMKQKANKRGETKKKGEATKNLRDFRSEYTPTQSPPRGSLRKHTPNAQAADRAAAAMFLSEGDDSEPVPGPPSTEYRFSIDSSPGQKPKGFAGWSNVSMTGKKQGVVRNMGEFYKIQKKKRRLEVQKKKETLNMYQRHQYGVDSSRYIAKSKLAERSSKAASAKQDETKETEMDVIPNEVENQDSILEKLGDDLKAIGEDEDLEEEPEVDDDSEADDTVIPVIQNPTIAIDYKQEDYRGFIFVGESCVAMSAYL